MAPAKLEPEDHQRDAEFNRVLHGKSAEARGGFMAMRNKDPKAQKAAVDEYFKHWDNKSAKDETEEIREVSLLARGLGSSTVLTAVPLTGTTSRVRDLDPTVCAYSLFSLAMQCDADAILATTTWRPTSTSTDGAARSISAASRTESPSSRPLPAMSTTWRSRWA